MRLFDQIEALRPGDALYVEAAGRRVMVHAASSAGAPFTVSDPRRAGSDEVTRDVGMAACLVMRQLEGAVPVRALTNVHATADAFAPDPVS